MAEDRIKDFKSRKGVSQTSPPHRPFPKFSDVVSTKRPGDREKWEEMDAKLEDWRKTFLGT